MSFQGALSSGKIFFCKIWKLPGKRSKLLRNLSLIAVRNMYVIYWTVHWKTLQEKCSKKDIVSFLSLWSSRVLKNQTHSFNNLSWWFFFSDFLDILQVEFVYCSCGSIILSLCPCILIFLSPSHNCDVQWLYWSLLLSTGESYLSHFQ